MRARVPVFFFLLLALCCVSASLRGQEGTDGAEFVIDGFKLETQPGGHYYSNFIENLAPDAVWLTEESNGFGLLDQAKVYFEGDSWTQFHWFYAGHGISSALDDGVPALQIPFLAIGAMALRGETPKRRDYGFHFVPRPPLLSRPHAASRVMFSTVLPNMGGYTPLGKLAIGNHASLRADDLYHTRRRIGGSTQLDFSHESDFARSSLLLAGGYLRLDRRFNDFNERDAQFAEDNELLQLLARWQRRFARGHLGLDLVLNAGGRGNLGAEDGRYPQETYDQKKSSWLAAASWSGRPFDLRLSWLHEQQELRPFAADAGKDLVDIDGQGFLPFEKWGTFSADTLALAVERTFRFSWLGKEAAAVPFLDVSAVFHAGRERTGTHDAIRFAGQPYLVYLWQSGQDYRNMRQSATLGSLFRMDLSGRLAFNARLFLQYQGLGFQETAHDVRFLHAGGEAGLSYQAGKRTNLSLSYGVLPYEMRAAAAEFLEAQRPGAAIHFWRDLNRDGLFQDGEQGPLWALSGASSHAPARDLKPSLRERLELLLTMPLSARFDLDVKALYKRIRRPLWVSFAGAYGHYEEVEGKRIYLLDEPVTAYELGNAAFAKDPFYAQFLLRIHGEKARRWYFSFSFLAHIGMGTTAFGNGPEANDYGVISESQAFPNSWVNGFGRVDGDRAFVGKVFFGYYLAPRLFLGGSVKYRDGNPFAFIDALQRGGQWVITYQTIKAEDEHSKKGGPREDCIWDFSFKLGYDLTLFGMKARLEISLFNLLDFGGELSENVFSGGSRLANELQLPRSLRLGAVLEL